MPFPEMMTTGSGGDSAAGLYLRPSWMEFDPAQRMAQAIQASRAAKDRESQDLQGQQNTEFEQGREQNKDAIAQQDWQMKVQSAAAQQARQSAYQAKVQDIQANPNLSPEQRSQAISMAFLESMSGDPDTSAGTASALRALAPPKPVPQLQPLTMPGTEPTAATAATPAADNSLPPMPPEWTAPKTPQASPAPLIPPTSPNATAETSAPTSSPNARMVHPAYLYGDKYIPAQFAPTEKPVSPQKPITTRPGEVLVDPTTKQPFFTNTTVKAESPDAIKEVPPGGVLMKGGQPIYTNTNFKASAPVSKKPEASSSVKAGTKVQNSKGEIKWTKTDGSLPAGWTVSQ